MPKQFWKINKFHGGLNNNSDPRDIADNELSESTGIMVDELGKIRMMGEISESHDAPANAANITPGYGLFQFSHDRLYGHIGGVEHLNNTSVFTSNWDITNGFTVSGDYATYAHDVLGGTLIQTAANRVTKGVAGATYEFVYTVASYTGDAGTFRITGGGGQFASGNTALNKADGEHSVRFVSGEDADQPFTIEIDSSVSGGFTMDYVSLKIVSAAETGDDYLAMVDVNSAQVDIYSKYSDVWSQGTIDLGTGGSMKAAFYVADGTLRVSDGNREVSPYGAGNQTMWYGYIYRYFLGDGTAGYDGGALTGDLYQEGLLVDKWYTSEAVLTSLNVRTFTGRSDAAAPNAGSPISGEMEGTPHRYVNTFDTGAEAFIQPNSDRIQIQANFEPAAPNIAYLALHGTGQDLLVTLSNFASPGDKILIHDSDSGDNDGIFTVFEIIDNYGSSQDLLAIDEDFVSKTDDTVKITNLSRSDWFDPVNQNWECAVTTLYDDSKQESALHDSEDVLEPDDIISTATGVGMKDIALKVHVYAGDGRYNGIPIRYPRVSGFNIYMRQQNSGSWYLQANVDITKGIKWVDDEVYTMWNAATDVGSETAYATTNTSTTPKRIVTYQSNSGNSPDVSVVGVGGSGTGFKTAVVANRMAYIGNVKTDDGKVHGDAVFKSHVNKFDSFTKDRVIEAAVNDGDAIVKLETYADRLLIFKKTKLELVNISQEVEFFEDVFMHKGVTHPSATCKTDFGIAWVNKQGCYLYDGEKVNNLLEKGGRQIIKESEWDTFTTREPMIGYLPKKRQLIVVDDNTSSGNGNIYLYDIVTQSWTRGANGTFSSSSDLTNFVTDWNADLMYAHTDNTGTMAKWVDASAAQTGFKMYTKDIDFGEPGQKKTVYKVYMSYRGDGSAVGVYYLADGDDSPLLTFYRTNADGTSEGSTTDTTPLVDTTGQTWVQAELVPVASVKDIYSFRFLLYTAGDMGASDFEVNDITIVYRLKGQR